MRRWRRDVIAASIACLVIATAFNSIIQANRAVIEGSGSARGGKRGPDDDDAEDDRSPASLSMAGMNARSFGATTTKTTTKRKGPEWISRTSDPRKARGDEPPPRERLPNVLLIGAQKGGSSALASWLFDSGVCRPKSFPGEPKSRDKEVHFFDKIDRYEKGLAFYARRFRHCDGEQRRRWLALDATPNYLPFADKVMETYRAAGGGANGEGQIDTLRIIMVLREPVARELSLYNHKAAFFRKNNTERGVFWKDVLKKDGQLMSFGQYVNRTALRGVNPATGLCKKPFHSYWWCFSLYAHPLRHWIKLFGPGRILLLSYDELVQDERKVRWRVQRFLGLDDDDPSPRESKLKPVNVQHSEEKLALPPCHVQAKLAAAFRKANQELYDLLETKREPDMEQRPFPHFTLSNCTTTDGKVRTPSLHIA